MLYQGETVAFSTKANVWKTRYSFNPTCYMDMDNDFLSSAPQDEEDTNLAWRHDIATGYNTFYGTLYESIIEVSSNQNPSATKAFKAVSLETSAEGWNSIVRTNIDKGGNISLVQEGTIRSFDSKEGNQYASMPRNSQGNESTSNLTYVGSVTLNDLVPGYNSESDVSIADLVVPGAAQIQYEVPLQSIPSISITPSEASKFYIPSPAQNNQLSSFVFQQEPIPQGSYETIYSLLGYNIDAMSIVGYNSETNSIILQTPILSISQSGQQLSLTTLFALIAEYSSESGVTEFDFDAQIPVYMMTNPRINGDMMRGPYANISIIRDSASPFELFSINVDFENTKLDGSLG
jgi:hypothetical protein|tara:strand:+ start:2446 stop:3489 length:1044 start_codon:yes stop_codon:yes gene_type:complete